MRCSTGLPLTAEHCPIKADGLLTLSLRPTASSAPVATATVAIGGIAVTTRTIPHIGNTLGFRIEADGVTVAPCTSRDRQAAVVGGPASQQRATYSSLLR